VIEVVELIYRGIRVLPSRWWSIQRVRRVADTDVGCPNTFPGEWSSITQDDDLQPGQGGLNHVEEASLSGTAYEELSLQNLYMSISQRPSRSVRDKQITHYTLFLPLIQYNSYNDTSTKTQPLSIRRLNNRLIPRRSGSGNGRYRRYG